MWKFSQIRKRIAWHGGREPLWLAKKTGPCSHIAPSMDRSRISTKILRLLLPCMAFEVLQEGMHRQVILGYQNGGSPSPCKALLFFFLTWSLLQFNHGSGEFGLVCGSTANLHEVFIMRTSRGSGDDCHISVDATWHLLFLSDGNKVEALFVVGGLKIDGGA